MEHEAHERAATEHETMLAREGREPARRGRRSPAERAPRGGWIAFPRLDAGASPRALRALACPT